MSSKYDSFWRLRLNEIQRLLEEARKKGTSREIDVNDLADVGERESWYGTVVVSEFGTKSSMAHTTSLGNILNKSGILRSFENETFRLTVSRGLKLHVELVSPQIDKVTLKPKVRVTEVTPVEPVHTNVDYGRFYKLIRDFEQEVRSFITEMLGKSWIKRLENDAPAIVRRWKERRDADVKWGIDPEENLINYANLTDYIQIIERYRKTFSESDRDLGLVKAHFDVFAMKGRNPVMHCRDLSYEEYYTTRGAEKFLRKWIERTRKRRARFSKNLMDVVS